MKKSAFAEFSLITIANLFLFLALIFAVHANAEKPSGLFSQADLEKKLSNLEKKLKENPVNACVPVGLDCTSSIDCCGAASCWQGICNDGGSSCHGNGATCNSSIDCCGSMSCWQGRCNDPSGPSCYPKGAVCNSSIDCCGSMSCWQGRCD